MSAIAGVVGLQSERGSCGLTEGSSSKQALTGLVLPGDNGGTVNRCLTVGVIRGIIRYHYLIYMRTIIDIPDEQIRPLAEQCKEESISRAELIRRAIALYLEQRRRKGRDAFGLWRGRGQDGVEYQRSLRSEWGE